jgi:hypothetical protein
MQTERVPAVELGASRPWALEVDAEAAPGAHDVTAEQAAALAALLARHAGVERVDARVHGGSRFVLVRLTVRAVDLADASDRACTFVHGSAADAGLRPLVLVGVRCAR